MKSDNNASSFSTACEEGCVEGQMRCIGSTGANSLLRCCNWYLNDICHVTCPDPLVGDPETFDCGESINIQSIFEGGTLCFDLFPSLIPSLYRLW